MNEFKPKDDFEVVVKPPQDRENTDSLWFIIHHELGVRLHQHSSRRGLSLTLYDFRELKKVVDYLVENQEPSLEGMRRATHPEDFLEVVR